MDGGSPNEGRVEVHHQTEGWGTICDDSWGNSDATVICRMLGYTSGVARDGGTFSPGTVPIGLDDVQCNGWEENIFGCVDTTWGVHNCAHSEDAGVICSKIKQDRLIHYLHHIGIDEHLVMSKACKFEHLRDKFRSTKLYKTLCSNMFYHRGA